MGPTRAGETHSLVQTILELRSTLPNSTSSSNNEETAFTELSSLAGHRARTPHPAHLHTNHTATLGTGFPASEIQGLERISPDLNPGSALAAKGPECLQWSRSSHILYKINYTNSNRPGGGAGGPLAQSSHLLARSRETYSLHPFTWALW